MADTFVFVAYPVSIIWTIALYRTAHRWHPLGLGCLGLTCVALFYFLFVLLYGYTGAAYGLLFCLIDLFGLIAGIGWILALLSKPKLPPTYGWIAAHPRIWAAMAAACVMLALVSSQQMVVALILGSLPALSVAAVLIGAGTQYVRISRRTAIILLSVVVISGALARLLPANMAQNHGWF